jgi:hypothetical protein
MKTKPHRKRKGWDCPHCKMHFGWERQYAAHIEGRHCQDVLPPYDEWRKLPPDDAARILAKHRNLDAEQEGLIAAILEHFKD